MTLVPIERELLIPEEMTPAERRWLNDYHARVYETVSPLLDEAERAWLFDATRPI